MEFPNVKIFGNIKIYGKTEIGYGSVIFDNCILGFPQGDILKEILEKNLRIEEYDFPGTVVGKNAVIRSGCVFYSNVSIGDQLRTGHNVLVREKTKVGNKVLIGTNTVIDGDTKIGNHVSIQSNVYIPINTEIDDYVFLGPNAVLTNDKYPVREKEIRLIGPRIRKGASIGSNSVILPDIEIGEGAIIGSGSVVTKDIPEWSIALGNPARVIKKVPEELRVLNRIGI